MAFQAHGSLSEFSSSQETWTAYVKRLEQYLAANKIEDADQQRAILLSCGPATYQLICSLMSPKKPAELKFTEITETVQKHHDPKPSTIVQHYRFNTRHRRVGESVSTYVAELHHLSNHCDFGPSLQQMLRDRLVCGIEDPNIQWRLLAEPDLTFDKAFELALAPIKMPRIYKLQNHLPSRATHMLTEDTDEYSLYNLTRSPVQPLVVSVKVNNVDLKMELDTGASVSIISEATYNHHWPQGQAPALRESHVKLKTYTGE